MSVFARFLFTLSLGITSGLFLRGIYSRDFQSVSIAYVYLLLVWVFREINLGYDEETNKFKAFLPWRWKKTETKETKEPSKRK
jgi:hypothetical protein